MKLFTDNAIKRLPSRSRRYEVREPGGLGLWVYPSGRRSWVLTYHHAGRKERVVLGEYPAVTLARARELAQGARSALAEGHGPGVGRKSRQRAAAAAEEAAQREPTVEALVGDYLERWAKPRKRSWAEDERRLAEVVRRWGPRRAREVTRGEVRRLLDEVLLRGPYAANRLLAVLRRCFGWAVEVDLLTHSPCDRVRAPGVERARDRVLTPAELRVLWAGLPATPQGRVLRLILVTAQRPGEVAGIAWEEVADGWWTIPGARTKNGQAHRVPLAPLALRILGEAGAGPVFVGEKGGALRADTLPHVLNRGRGGASLRERLGLAHFTPHDLRRTAASLMAGAGVPRLVVGRILNHVEPGVTAVYDRHSYDAEKRAALEAWAARLEGITG